MKIILFDGICNLCDGIVLFIIKRDKKELFRFAALQSAAGKELRRRYSLPDERYDTVYYIRDDTPYQKSAAILHILRDLGGGWRLFYCLIRIPAGARDAIYTWIARNRYRLFGKKTSCLLPGQEIRNRYLEFPGSIDPQES